jgi:hypothetical protein
MQRRRRFKHTISLEERLAEEARRFREEPNSSPMDLFVMKLSEELDRLRLALT